MQLEPYDQKDGYRCWLGPSEQDHIVDFYEEDMVKQTAIRLLLHGLRADEVPRVCKDDIRELNSEEEAYKLRVREGKTGWRECPIDRDLKADIHRYYSIKGVRATDPVVDYTKRSVQQWVTDAADALQEETGDDDWQYVTGHDLRRTWATTTYWRLNATDSAKSVLMRWGGWSDEQTFERNYLGREPDHVAAEMMTTAGIR